MSDRRLAILSRTPLCLMISLMTMWLSMGFFCRQAECQVVHVEVKQPEKPPPITQIEYANHVAAVLNAELIEAGYLVFGKQDEKWDDDVIEFIQLTNLCRCGHPLAPSEGELRIIAERVADTGCDDPLVLYFIGRALDLAGVDEAPLAFLKEAYMRLPSSGYSNSALAASASRLGRWVERSADPNSAIEYHREAMEGYLKAATELPGDVLAIRELTEELCFQVEYGLPEDLAGEFADRLVAMAHVDACMSHTVMGYYHKRIAWLKRGTGFANTVTEEGWEGFAKHLQIARKHLETAHSMDPSRPEAAAAMIAVTMAGYSHPEDCELTWFDRAVAAQFDYPEAYRAVLWALRPRWGGTHEAMYAFGVECLETQRFDTIVPLMYIEAIESIVSDSQGGTAFLAKTVSYPRVADIVDRSLEVPQHAHMRQNLKSRQLAIAWATGHYDDARTVLRELRQSGRPIDFPSIKAFRMRSRDLEDDIIIRSSALASEVLSGDAMLRRGESNEALAVFEKAISAAPAEDLELRDVLNDRIATARVHSDFLTGEWVSLRFDRNLPGWRNLGGAWHAPTPSRIRAGFDGTGRVALVHRAPFGRRLEISGTLDMGPLGWNYPNAGFLFSFNERYGDIDWLIVRIIGAEKAVRVGHRFSYDESVGAPLPTNKPKRQFHIQLWDDRVRVSIDGVEVFARPVPMGEDARLGNQIGLGGYGSRPNGFARFEDLRVRKLSAEPPSVTAPVALEESP